jgi:hypothetical protein
MVESLGARAAVPASAGAFAQALAVQGQSQEALAAGTGPFPPSPAPSSTASAATATTQASTAALIAAATAGGTGVTAGALDTSSYGDGATGPIAAGTLAGGSLAAGSASALATAQAVQLAAAGGTASSPLSPAVAPAGAAGQRALAAAQTAIGITEDPPGSNDGPGLAIFRSSTAGAQAGQPWCAYFASWAALQAGAPVGDNGQGSGSVEGIADWAGRTGRLMPPGSTPAPGDLVLFGGRHVGVVEAVNPDGTLQTVEGNYRNSVQRVTRSPLEATGYVRLG